MANLSDFLGNVVSNISKSRANADLQTVEIAKHYANDSLLKHFSVPRFRIDSVELNIPIAVNGYSQFSKKVFSQANKEDLSKQTIEIVKKNTLLKNSDGHINKNISILVKKLVESLSIEFTSEDKKGLIKKYADSVTAQYPEWLIGTFKELKSKPPTKTEITKAQYTLNNHIINTATNFVNTSLQNQIANELDIIVETAKLKEIAPTDKIMITMKISEHGMEWIKMEDEKGATETRLLPE